MNFRVEPEVVQKLLPTGLTPKLQDEHAIAGICLIRLEHIRPALLPAMGLSSENAAHRVAVKWTAADGSTREGVYIPKRHTNSALIRILGGRLFPGVHQSARFDMVDTQDRIQVAIQAAAGDMAVVLTARPADALPQASVFPSMEAASQFFRGGSVGYSPSRAAGRLEGLRLVTPVWKVSPLAVDGVRSSWLEDSSLFPPGSVKFDCALVMRDVEHRWQGEQDLYVDSVPAAAGLEGESARLK